MNGFKSCPWSKDIKMHIKWEKTCPKLDNYCTPHILAKLLLSNCPTIQDKSVDHKYLVPFDLVHAWQIAMVSLKKLCELLLPSPPPAPTNALDSKFLATIGGKKSLISFNNCASTNPPHTKRMWFQRINNLYDRSNIWSKC